MPSASLRQASSVCINCRAADQGIATIHSQLCTSLQVAGWHLNLGRLYLRSSIKAEKCLCLRRALTIVDASPVTRGALPRRRPSRVAGRPTTTPLVGAQSCCNAEGVQLLQDARSADRFVSVRDAAKACGPPAWMRITTIGRKWPGCRTALRWKALAIPSHLLHRQRTSQGGDPLRPQGIPERCGRQLAGTGTLVTGGRTTSRGIKAKTHHHRSIFLKQKTHIGFIYGWPKGTPHCRGSAWCMESLRCQVPFREDRAEQHDERVRSGDEGSTVALSVPVAPLRFREEEILRLRPERLPNTAWLQQKMHILPAGFKWEVEATRVNNGQRFGPGRVRRRHLESNDTGPLVPPFCSDDRSHGPTGPTGTAWRGREESRGKDLMLLTQVQIHQVLI